MKSDKIFFKFKMLILGIVVLGGFSLIVMVLWNWLMPEIFGLTGISFWQALGLLILSRILLGGFVKDKGHRHHKIRNHLRDKWLDMKPEEREAFIEKRRAFMRSRRQGCHHNFWKNAEDDKKSSSEERETPTEDE